MHVSVEKTRNLITKTMLDQRSRIFCDSDYQLFLDIRSFIVSKIFVSFLLYGQF